MKTIAVIGGGITGITTAYALAKRGFAVTLLEKHRYAAMETSFANGGQLSASNAEVWNHWSTILKGIKWMLKSDAPLLVNPKPSWHKLSCGLLECIAARTISSSIVQSLDLLRVSACALSEGPPSPLDTLRRLHVFAQLLTRDRSSCRFGERRAKVRDHEVMLEDLNRAVDEEEEAANLRQLQHRPPEEAIWDAAGALRHKGCR